MTNITYFKLSINLARLNLHKKESINNASINIKGSVGINRKYHPIPFL